MSYDLFFEMYGNYLLYPLYSMINLFFNIDNIFDNHIKKLYDNDFDSEI